ncbi:dipeptidyl aminopeptidase/acylaminoacyl peptidase [Filimonas zeae]|uniref:Peptidase n=1 Tax=Filimonas zeae TaxID=1737353 RepID=A0A917J3C0_9BACT|nr:S9 family peptidase [Filimonas zeae]MDR6341887.1 dipeptidyl aminopeptidase/acylaminoacyl peptidase [Filimonas zeae]GGH79948.1 peptidase [Filimonas zeae]
MKIFYPFLTATCLLVTHANAQQALPLYTPGHEEMMLRYKKAAILDSVSRNTVFKSSVNPNWQHKEAFWYCNVLKDSVREYVYVDAGKAVKRPAFDADKMAAGLQAATGKTFDASRLKISRMDYSTDGKQLSFELDKQYFVCTLPAYICRKADTLSFRSAGRTGFQRKSSRWESFETASQSPDGSWEAVIKEGNVLIRNKATGAEQQYTTDGTQEKPYGSIAWASDSRYLVCYHIAPAVDTAVYYVLTSVAGTKRGQLRSQPYKQPGDPFTTYEMFVCSVGEKAARKINTPVIDFFEAPALHWRKNDSRYFLFERIARGHQQFTVTEVDIQTGNTRNVLEEKTNTFIYESRLFTSYLAQSDEMIMTSERDGWQHLYLINTLTGSNKQITKGEWVVRSVDSVDAVKREIWFSASGRNKGEDPYNVHYYRIAFDGTKLMDLTPAPGNHTVLFSPGKAYFLDTYSQINVPAVTELHATGSGKTVLALEQADISLFLSKGVRLPEPFHAKGRDGVTDIYGILCRPADFDSSKAYPLIEYIYAGPQDAFVPKSFLSSLSEMQSLAALGFMVVQIDGMGTANRSKAFHDVCWKNLADGGFPDRILWMKALAGKYSYIDTTRVGVYGTSAGGQNALGALLFHPEFYKAAVAACGCHDNRVDKQWWNEQWMGYPVGKHYEEQSNVTNAYRLQGELMLVVGEADTNVPPESTYRVADALIKAGKTFEFLPVPGLGHSDGGPYGKIRKRDFFVQHLLNTLPPKRNQNELKQTH